MIFSSLTSSYPNMKNLRQTLDKILGFDYSYVIGGKVYAHIY